MRAQGAAAAPAAASSETPHQAAVKKCEVRVDFPYGGEVSILRPMLLIGMGFAPSCCI